MWFRNGIVIFLSFVFAGACCVAWTLLIGKIEQASQLRLTPPSEANPIIDIWINRMESFFLVLLPDNTAKIYESYSFDLDNVGKWKKVEDRAIYPESPAIRLPSYKVEFEDDRVIEIFLYPIYHHDGLVVEDKIIGHRGYNRLSDTDDPNGFYHKRFTQGLPQDLSIVNSYWESHNGRPAH